CSRAPRRFYFRWNPDRPPASGGPPMVASLSEILNASTNAPVNYFDAPAGTGGRRCWDGGLAGNNNPVLGAVVEALANGVRAESIDVLNIGTGQVFLAPDPPAEDPALLVPKDEPNL